MNDDYAGRSDLWAAMKDKARTGHAGDRVGRIFDGCIWVTEREWRDVYSPNSERLHSEKSLAEKLATLPVRVLKNGDIDLLEDDRMLFAVDDVIYLIAEGETTHPALPRLHIDGIYI